MVTVLVVFFFFKLYYSVVRNFSSLYMCVKSCDSHRGWLLFFPQTVRGEKGGGTVTIVLLNTLQKSNPRKIFLCPGNVFFFPVLYSPSFTKQ